MNNFLPKEPKVITVTVMVTVGKQSEVEASLKKVLSKISDVELIKLAKLLDGPKGSFLLANLKTLK